MTRLWDRGEPLDEVVARLTVGNDPSLDRLLVAHDALASAAHATMLEGLGVVSSDEREVLHRELRSIADDARSGDFDIDPEDEDGHTAIENRLTEKLGDPGRKIHTGRSRNDQVIAALRLWGREALLTVYASVLELIDALAERSSEHAETVLPGYSHTRQAMPTTFGHWLRAHAESLADDLPWLRRAYEHLNRSPLGSASGFGVALDLDRELVAELLGFDGVQVNTLAVQNDRGKSEWLAVGAAVAVATDLGRLAGDLIWLSSDELRFVRLPQRLTTGSSIMPQKRNPDVLELIRAGAASLRARQAEIAAVYAPLGSGYHRDLQLTKEPFLDGLTLAADLVRAMRAVVEGFEVDAERARAALLPATGATDVLYSNVASGQPFRTAYREIAGDPDGAVADDSSEAWRSRTHLGAPGSTTDPSPAAPQDARAWWSSQAERNRSTWERFGRRDHESGSTS